MRIKKTFHATENLVVITQHSTSTEVGCDTRRSATSWREIFCLKCGKYFRTNLWSSCGQVRSWEHLDSVAGAVLRLTYGSGGSYRSLGSVVGGTWRSLIVIWFVGSGSCRSLIAISRSLRLCSITRSLRSWRTVTWLGTLSTSEKSADSTENSLY